MKKFVVGAIAVAALTLTGGAFAINHWGGAEQQSVGADSEGYFQGYTSDEADHTGCKFYPFIQYLGVGEIRVGGVYTECIDYPGITTRSVCVSWSEEDPNVDTGPEVFDIGYVSPVFCSEEADNIFGYVQQDFQCTPGLKISAIAFMNGVEGPPGGELEWISQQTSGTDPIVTCPSQGSGSW